MHYETITLLIPVERGEDRPCDWNWNALLDTSHPVVVEANYPVHERDLPPECLEALAESD